MTHARIRKRLNPHPVRPPASRRRGRCSGRPR